MSMRPPPLSSWAGCAATGLRRAVVPLDPGRWDVTDLPEDAAGLALDTGLAPDTGLALDVGFASAAFGVSAFLPAAGFSLVLLAAGGELEAAASPDVPLPGRGGS
jgi:hypothetical protein